MPDYYDEGLIETLSLTSTGAKRKITAFLRIAPCASYSVVCNVKLPDIFVLVIR